MNFDFFTLSALVDELRATVVDGRVQDVLDLNEDAIGLEVYKAHERHYLVLDANPRQPHATLVEGKVRRGLPKPTQLGLLLRRYAEGAFLVDVTQPDWERILILHLDGPGGVSQLIVETIERRANILLVQEGMILDCIRRVGARDNRVRVSLPGRDYVPPPPQQGKLAPADLTLADVAACLDADPDVPAWRTLTRRVLGVSPLLGREIAYRATGNATITAADTSPRALLEAFQEKVGPLLERAWRPGTAQTEDGRVSAFAPYRLSHLPSWTPAPSMSAALATYYGAPVGEDAYDRAKQPVAAQLKEAITRVSRKAEALDDALRSEAEMGHLRQAGELLLAYQYAIPAGAIEFEAEYDLEGPPVHIRLDPALSALDNAKRYFEKYDKAKRALEGVPARLKAARNELAFLRQLEVDLALASSWPEIDEVREALERDGYWRGPHQARPQTGKSAPLKLTTPDGFVIWVGRNARQNDQVTFDKGTADDVWCHVRGLPGAHVIVKTGGRAVPEDVLQRAAELAAYYSGVREESRTQVDVTQRKHVRKIKGGKAGQVTYRHEITRDVTPRGPEDAA